MSFANLAERMRPKNLNDFLGQKHLIGEGKVLAQMVKSCQPFSIIFWGPPGCGKTTLARILADSFGADFFNISAVATGKSDLSKILAKAQINLDYGKRTMLFIDEIHRWNKAQQAYLLPYVEKGVIFLIGATTENPSFEVISPLLSRCRTFVLEPLDKADLELLVERSIKDADQGLGKYDKQIDDEAVKLLLRLSGGDARVLLNALEIAATSFSKKIIDRDVIKEVFQKKTLTYDKKEEEHYNTISAFIKSLRGSDANAALYYMLRMLDGGEDPKFIARRMIVFASEDIGLEDRAALILANEAFEAVEKIGLPECKLTLTHAAIYLAQAPKSRVVANALMSAARAVEEYPDEPVPLHLRNAPTKLMKELGYSKDYKWSKDYVGPTNEQSFFPDKLKNKKFVS